MDAAKESGHRARPLRWPKEMKWYQDDAMTSSVDSVLSLVAVAH